MNESETHHIVARLPIDVWEWLKETARRNVSSQRAEIVRALRERMEREAMRR